MQITALLGESLSGWLALSMIFGSMSIVAVVMALRKPNKLGPHG